MCNCKGNNFSINPETGELYKTCDKCRKYGKQYNQEHKEQKRLYRQKNISKRLLHDTRRSDEKNNRENNLTLNYINDLINECKSNGNRCFYETTGECKTNQELDWNIARGRNIPSNRASIERLDNDIGHVIGNCVFSCWHCNHRKVSNGIDHNTYCETCKHNFSKRSNYTAHLKTKKHQRNLAKQS